jgi:hypothetical protein
MARLFFTGTGGGGGGGIGIGEFVFADFGTQDESQGRYTSWTDLMAKLATIQLGAAPLITIALVTGPFAIPLAGMPVTGWDFRGGTVRGATTSVGTIVLDCAPGVKLDNLVAADWLVIKIAPPAGTGVIEFTATPIGGRIFLNRGGYIDHSTAPGALMRSPGTNPGGDTSVLASFEANWLQAPPFSGPLIFLSNDGGFENDGGVLTQIGCLGGLPNGALANNNALPPGNATPSLVLFHDASANPATLDLPTFVPGYTGPLSFSFLTNTATPIGYDDALAPAPAIPLGVLNVQAAIDALKNPSNYIPSGNAFPPGTWAVSDPANMSEAIDRIAALLVVLNAGPIP